MSSSFKTPKGTELPFFMIERRQKDRMSGQWKSLPPQAYLQVAHRLVWFREEHPTWTIRTIPISTEESVSVFRAEILDDQGRLIACAHKREDSSGFADHLEKAETGAIGRALALVGYGTQFAPELDEEHRVVDSPVSPAKKAVDSRTAPSAIPGQPNNRVQDQQVTADMLAKLAQEAKKNGWAVSDLVSYAQRVFGKTKGTELTREEFAALQAVSRSSNPKNAMQELDAIEQQKKVIAEGDQAL
jgi:hypothetical protein